ncbi:hypothetical protein BB559_002892 [Furculomyces boomerangus]|uniref:U3 small nucleolar RNA-associated protein 11 n=2 Tax=Harpellales TaxID=61421 RepID=A0A2T9YRC8_9FUNG|nr:hypothetical protein BB559_002892 [Furculomyces boomerangus]PVZ98819.1 hypothetical protein BB558_005173 [Smittium angustum]
MSSFKKSNPRRDHKERSQPINRSKYGLLEKHKDYVLRAKNYHLKEDRLKLLREKARGRNDDEFYFSMEKERTKEDNSTDPSFDFLGDFDDSDDDIQDSEMDKQESSHTIFVDDEEELARFNPSKHFDTPKELLSRKFNRVKTDKIPELVENMPDSKTVKALNKERGKLANELAMRIDREQHIKRVLRELEIQRELMKKGRKKVTGKDTMGLPIYKWKADRKK